MIKTASREKRRRSGSLSAVAEEGLANAALVQGPTVAKGLQLERFPPREPGEWILEAEPALGPDLRPCSHPSGLVDRASRGAGP